MTKKQLAALQRILAREKAAYQVCSGRPAPGQHPSEDKYAITDGTICVLMDGPEAALPVGEQADTFARIVRNERKSEAHVPVPADQINVSKWRTQAKRQSSQSQGAELTAPILRPEQLCVDDLDAPTKQLRVDDLDAPTKQLRVDDLDTSTVVVGHFDPQLLVDAVEAVGGNPLFFLGYGRFNSRFPSLLVMPPEWTELNCTNPIVLILTLPV